jgi:RHS repeat-associated protein
MLTMHCGYIYDSAVLLAYQFTGKERDAESGLDMFGARYYGSSLGRFMTADRPFEDQHARSPQSWNLYSYARNNPLRYTDATGNACVQGSDGNYRDDNSGGETCAQVDQNNKNAQASATVTATDPGPLITGGLIAVTPFQRAIVRGGNAVKNGLNLLRDPRVSAYLSVFAFEADAGEEEELNAEDILFSQSSVNNTEEIIASMQARGWIGSGVDVVKLEDGTLVTLDNSRVFAAGQAGIQVKAVVHDAADMISPERGQAFLEQYGTRPSTWGDAAQLRIGNQSAGFRDTYPNGSPYTGVK